MQDGRENRLVTCSVLILQSSVAIMFTSWVLTHIMKIWRDTVNKNQVSSKHAECAIFHICGMEVPQIECVAQLTVIDVISAMITLLITLCINIFRVTWIIHGHNWDQTQNHSVHRMIGILIVISMCLSYTFLTLVQYSRLRMLFDHTHYALPDWSDTLLMMDYILVLIITIIIIIGNDIRTLRIIGLSMAILNYLALNVCLLYSFITRTLSAAKRARRCSISSRSSQNIDGGLELFNLAIKMTICVTISVLTSMICLFGSAGYYYWGWQWTNVWMISRNMLIVCDMSVNAYCLLCTFSEANLKYRYVFGRLHDSLLYSAMSAG